jgi:hypothetical protein
MTLAVLRRRGVLALVAGLVFLFGVPIYQALWLRPAGFIPPRLESIASFGAYLEWAAAHSWIDLTSRAVDVVPFLLAITLPAPIRLILWGENRAEGRAPMLLGQLGFGLFAVVLLLGFVVVPNAAHDYLTQPANRADIARSYHALYEFETVIATVIGLGMIALSLAMLSLRGIATVRVPAWYAYIGLATAGLLAATAAFALFGLSTAAAQVQQFSLPALALWMILTGALLLRIQMRPVASAPVAEGAEPTAPMS